MAMTKEQFVELSVKIASFALSEAKAVGASRSDLGAVLVNVLEAYAETCVIHGLIDAMDQQVCKSLDKQPSTGHS